jgi:8-oxoguanine deaminase
MIGRLTYRAADITHLDARWRPTAGVFAQEQERNPVDLLLMTPIQRSSIVVGRLFVDPYVRASELATLADRVMIGGQWRVVDGAPLGVDVARLRHEHGEAAKRFLQEV